LAHLLMLRCRKAPFSSHNAFALDTNLGKEPQLLSNFKSLVAFA